MGDRRGAAALVTNVVLEVFRLNGLLLRAGDDLTKDLGLSSARWQVLGAVATAPASMAAIGRRIGRARQSVREVSEKLVAAGLVEIIPDRTDRRAPRLTITQEGHDLLHAIAPRQIQWASDLATGFSESRLLASLQVLRGLEQRLTGTQGEDL